MGATRIEILGSVRARIDGVVTEITSPTQQLVLAVLAATRPEAVNRDRLTTAIWPEGPPPSAGNSLNTYLSRLRRVLGPEAIGRDGVDYRLELPLDADELDVDTTSIDGIRRALALWRGAPFGDLGGHPFLHVRAEQLGGRQHELRRRLVDLLAERGERAAAIEELQALVGDVPHDESSSTALVRLLTGLGRRADALRAAHSARTALAEVGLPPGRALLEAEQAALEPAGDRYGQTDLVGRTAELATLRQASDRHRLLTITGPGGVGKTALVRAHLDQMPGTQAVFCELGAATSTAEVELTIAQALGVTPLPPVRERLLTELGRRPRTLVLDACEHRLDDVRSLVAAGSSIAGVRIVATSRSPLGVTGEQLVELDPLDEDDAIELLRRRAESLDEEMGDADAAAEICRRVDHLPLGIELASSLLRVVEPDQLLRRLTESIDVLRSPDRSDRHRSLRATVEHSIDLLDPAERSTLLRLSAFVGPFTLERAEELLGLAEARPGDVAATVLALRNASLLHAVRAPSGRRLGMLDTVRAIVDDHLSASADHDDAIRAHLQVAVRTAHRIGAGIVSGDERRWARLADEELPELRAGHRRALALGDLDSATSLVSSLFQYAYDRVRPEIGAWADATLRRLPVGAPGTARLSASAALGAFQLGELDRAAELAEAVLRSDDPTAVARGAIVLANVHLVAGRLDQAMHAATTAISAAGDQDYVTGLGDLLLALAAHYAGEAATARASAARLEAVAARPGSAPSLTAYSSYCAAELSAAADPASARRHLEACLTVARAVGNAICEGVALVTAGTITSDDDPHEARRAFLSTIAHWRHRPDRYRQWITLRNFAVTLASCDDPRTAAFVLGATDAHAPPAYGAEADRLRSLRSALDDDLGAEASSRLRAAGARADLDDVVAVCLDGSAR